MTGSEQPAVGSARKSVDGWLMDGLSHHRGGRAADAERCYREALTLADDHPDAWHLLGVLRYQGGHPSEALACIERAIELAPAAAGYWCNLGNVLRARGEDERAVQAYQRALELEPGHADGANNLAKLHVEHGRIEAARTLLTALLARQPDHPQALNNLGLLHKKDGRLEDAVTCFQRALGLEASYHDARCNLGNTLKTMGRFREAAACFAAVVDAVPTDVAARCDYAEVLQELDGIEAATGQLVLAKTLEPDNARCLLELGALYQARGCLEEAEQEYRSLLRIRPDDPQALNNLGTLHRIRQEFDAALECFDRALQGDPNFADAYFNRGTVHADCGRLPEARAALEAAHRRNRGSVAVKENLINVYRRLQQLDRAQAVLEEWLDMSPQDPIALHLKDALGFGAAQPERCSEAYVRAEFDRAADHFDHKLTLLDYRGPTILKDHLARRLPPEAAGGLTVLDAGCGTGLCAEGLRPWSDVLVGVDLSGRMLEHAQRRELYDELHCQDLVAHLEARPLRYDLIAAADVFNYFGDLGELLAAARTALRPAGGLVFSLEQDKQADGYVLRDSGRFAHGLEYALGALDAAGFRDVGSVSVMLRLERGLPVWGYLLEAAAAGSSAC